MELSFVISALRKRFWVVVVLATLGNFLGGFLAPAEGSTFRSSVVLGVTPPASDTTVVLQSNQLERYVATELGVLGSEDLAAAVAARVGGGLTRPRRPR